MDVVLRHCRREDQNRHRDDHYCSGTVDDENCSVMMRKKMRFPETVDPPQAVVSPASGRTTNTGDNNDSAEINAQQQKELFPPRQWWFSRHSSMSLPQEAIIAAERSSSLQAANSSGMVLSEHLGKASDVVESLTHDVKNWSLTRLPSPAVSTKHVVVGVVADNNKDNNHSNVDSDRKKEKQKRCKEAQRQVRMAQRQCLEAQKRYLLSSTYPSTVD